MKKYRLTDETKIVDGHTLHRIIYLMPVWPSEAVKIGGWIEKEENLSHEGSAVVLGEAMVYGDALVCDNAMVYGMSRIDGKAKICENAKIFRHAQVSGNAKVCGVAQAFDDSRIGGNALVSGEARIGGCAMVSGKAQISGHAVLYGGVNVCGNSNISGDVYIYGHAKLSCNAMINSMRDLFWIENIDCAGSSKSVTFFKCIRGEIRVAFDGSFFTLTEFAGSMKTFYGDEKYKKIYKRAIKMAKAILGCEVGLNHA